jgi:hypothetical protein
MTRVRLAAVLVAAAAAFTTLMIAGSAHVRGSSHPIRALPLYMALPGGDVGEQLSQMDGYWNDRVTYPTGNFNPAWLRHAAEQADKIPSGIPAGRQQASARSASNAAASASSLAPDGFTSLGPQPERMTGCGGCFDYTTTAGRVNAIVVDPTTTTNGSIVAYAGSVGGGVWKTTNCCSGATTWSVTTDDPLISAISIDTLAIDPNNHNTIYAGTGDLNYGSFSMGSQGILKSTDAGAHWTVLGANVFGPAYSEPAGQFPQYDAVGKVRVDPNNSQNVVAGTKKGLFFSYDGGANWTGPCLTNGFTGQRQDITGLELSNMGGGVTRVLAAVGPRGFATTVQYDLGQNGANGLYSGTMAASGCPSFTSIARDDNGFVFGTQVTGSPYGTGAQLHAGSGDPYVSTSSTATVGNQLGRIDVAVAPSDPNVIYAQVQGIAPQNNSGGSAGCGNANGCQLGAWASTDGGSTWSFMAGSAGGSLKTCNSSGPGTNASLAGDYPQNWYDQGIAVDPNNPDRVFVDTFEVWLATRTGTTWYDTTCGYSGPNPKPVHVDQHALAFVPGSSGMLLAGNDGGVHGTANADAVTLNTLRPTWFNMDGGFNTIEYYSGDISGNFATSSSPSAAGGAQDNAPSVASFPGGPTGPVQWQLVTGGDGFYARIDPVGTGFGSRYFVGNNSGGMSRCSASATNTCVASGTGYSSVRGAWTGDTQSFIFPFDLFHGGISGGDDCAPAGTPGGCGHLVGGTTRVWETVSGGNATMNSASWYVTNNPSTQNMTKGTLGNRSFINQVKYSPKWSSVAAVGTNDANYWIGFNLGTGVAGQANWVDVTGGNSVLPNRPVLGVALDPSSPGVGTEVGYAAVGGFNANTPAQPGHVYQVSCTSSCASFTWLDKSGNLPDIPVDSVIVNPNFPQQVFAGTDFGLYFTNNVNAASPIWQKFTAGLPSAMIWDMQVDRGATTLSVWTRGRGAYAWPLTNAPVNRLNQTITFGPLADRPYTAPDFTVSATASSGLPVSFSAGANGACTVSGTTVHVVHYGLCTITASQPGNDDYNAAPDVSQSFQITDSVAPVTTATLTPGIQNGWYASPTLTLSADDGAGGSGVASITYSLDGGSSTTYSGPISGFSTGNHFVQYHATDVAGNVEATKLIAFKVDSGIPTVNITRPKNGSDFKQGQVVKANFKCTDPKGGSGLASCVGDVPKGSAINTSTVGDHTFSVTATDKAGNSRTVTSHYHVRYAFQGFFSPVTSNSKQKLNLAHAGDLLKVSFGLGGNKGLSAVDSVSSEPVSCPGWAPHSVKASSLPVGLSYNASTKHYLYGWDTAAGWAGTCRQFSLTLADGTVHRATFQFFA